MFGFEYMIKSPKDKVGLHNIRSFCAEKRFLYYIRLLCFVFYFIERLDLSRLRAYISCPYNHPIQCPFADDPRNLTNTLAAT